jgi:cell division protein FtsQ
MSGLRSGPGNGDRGSLRAHAREVGWSARQDRQYPLRRREDERASGSVPEGRGGGGLRPVRARKLLRCSLWGLGTGVSILAVYGLASALADSSLFVIQQVEVEASGRLGPDEIRSMSGIRPGMNLLSLNAADLRRRLETEPWVQNATVVKRLPDRILIKVRERRPAAVMGLHEDLYYLDEEGTLLGGVEPGERVDFPMITGLEKGVPDRGDCQTRREVQQSLALLRELQGTPGLGSVSEIHLDPSEGLSFVMEDFPSPVVAGWSDFSAKTSRFAKILPALAQEWDSIERVDLRFSNQVVIRQRTGGKPRVPREDRRETRAVSETFCPST